ncbi:MAG: N-acetylmuramoyl-L-alanine amidase [Clostridia bacterium]|nr:N-acetylmuramoyl-L-alanine amidase [Clostridia bacterium]
MVKILFISWRRIQSLIWGVVLAALSLAGIWGWSYYQAIKEEQSIKALSWVVANHIVAVDPGHGGIDDGAMGPGGTPEQKVNLDISKYLATYLSQGGARVFLTRQDANVYEGKSGDDLVERVKLSKRVGADLFISIHCNAFDNRESGCQVFYSPGSTEGKKLAEAIQASVKNKLKNTDRIAMGIDAYVLRTQDIPAVIVEVGFISNPKEEKLLADPLYQRQMAFAIYSGIIDYLTANT